MSKRKNLSKRDRFEVFKRDGFRCTYCGKAPPDVTLEIDHIVAVANGGPSSESNLVTSCFECNRGKSDVPLDRVPRGHEQTLKDREERLFQLRAITELAIKEEEAINETLELISRRWMEVIEEDPDEYELSESGRSTFRMFLKHMSLDEIFEAMEITSKKNISNKFRYLCGVCWRTIKKDLKPRWPS